MSNVTLLAVDLAKNIFQLHGTDKTGKIILKKKITRTKLLAFVANLPPCNIYMEACGSANYWGRRFEKLGHKIKSSIFILKVLALHEPRSFFPINVEFSL